MLNMPIYLYKICYQRGKLKNKKKNTEMLHYKNC